MLLGTGVGLRATVATVLMFAGPATTAFARNDGSPDGPRTHAAAPPITTTCGPLINSVVKTKQAYAYAPSTEFSVLPDAETTVIVPPGRNYCIRVVFTAEAECRFCYVLAMVGATRMNPDGGAFQLFSNAGIYAKSYSYEWVLRRGPGSHVVRIFWREGEGSDQFRVYLWTLAVTVQE
jgi:hypothetical protein